MGRPVDGEFQARVDDKGAPLSGFVSAVQARRAALNWFIGYLPKSRRSLWTLKEIILWGKQNCEASWYQ